MGKSRGLPWWLFALNIALLAALALWLFATYGYNEEGLVWFTRWTARVSFTFFIAAFVASALVRLKSGPAGKWLVRNRRYLGLNFALAHAVHLWALVTFFQMSGERVELVTIIFGGLAYVLAAAMAATSNDFSVRKLRRNWRRLHLTGVWYVWVIFTYTFLGQALEKPGYWAVMAVALAAPALRFLAWQKKRPKKPKPVSAA